MLHSYIKRFRTAVIYLSPAGTVRSSMGGVTTISGQEVPVSVSIQPLYGKLASEEYGERAIGMLAAFSGPDITVRPGDFARVYTAAKPDYRVADVKRWTSHIRLDLERL